MDNLKYLNVVEDYGDGTGAYRAVLAEGTAVATINNPTYAGVNVFEDYGDGTGALRITGISAGGSGNGELYSLDAQPQTYLTPWSDYFGDEAASLALWTPFQRTGNHEFFTENGQANFIAASTAGILNGMMQALPSGDCTVTGKFIHPFAGLSSVVVGFALLQDGIANPNTSDLQLFCVFDDASANFSIIGDRFSDYQTYASTPIPAATGLLTASYPQIYLRMRRSGTTWTFHYSPDGRTWTSFGSIAQAAFFVPKEFAVVVFNSGTNTLQTLKCEFVFVDDYENSPIPGGAIGGTVSSVANRFICIGDSITRGDGGVTAIQTYPHQLAKLLPGASVYYDGTVIKSDNGVNTWKVLSKARDGYTCQNVIDNILPNVVKFRDTSLTRDIALVFCGTNDLSLGDSGATVYTKLTTIVSTLKAAGFEVWLCTTIDRDSFSIAGFDTRRAALNTLITANTAGADKVVDLYADSRLQNAANATYFQADTIHPKSAGMGVIASLINAAI